MAKKESHERDLRKNKRCADMGVRLYRLRDHYCKQLDDSSINYTIDRKKLIVCGLFDIYYHKTYYKLSLLNPL